MGAELKSAGFQTQKWVLSHLITIGKALDVNIEKYIYCIYFTYFSLKSKPKFLVYFIDSNMASNN